MKKLICFVVLSLIVTDTFSQMYKPPKRRKDVFGSKNKDVRQLSNIGLQISIGPTFTLASANELKNDLAFNDALGNPVSSELKRSGKIGANAEIGLAHYNMKSPKFSFGRIIDYFDYGVGFKYFRGSEKTNLTFHDAAGRETEQRSSEGKLANGYLGFRFSVHKLSYIKNSALFLDNGLGAHANYLLLESNHSYPDMSTINQVFSKPLSVNLHYSFGLGIRLKRGSYLIPGAYVPILAMEEWGKESIHWFSSRYYPITCQIKWIYLLNKRTSKTNCTNNGTEEDKKKNKEYMQNK